MPDEQSKPITVLLIEDNRADAGLVAAHLAAYSNPSFTLHHESDLTSGLSRLRSTAVDIIVLDLSLPDSYGLETFLAVWRAANSVPIVILSGMSDDQVALEAVRQGAQDFFSKDEAISPSLGRLLQYSVERFRRQQVEREINSAAFIQRRLFPKPLPRLPGLDVGGRCDPANRVGGDYCDYFMVDEDKLFLVIGDVSGHGFGPSLVMAETRAALRTTAATTDDIGKMIRQVNQLLHHDELGIFVSLFLGCLNTSTGNFQYASAGHPAELVRADGSSESLESDDPPLGIQSYSKYEVRDTQLGAGDTLLLYTDGLSERAAGVEELFGVSRMNDVITSTSHLTAAQTIKRLFDEVNAFAHGRPVVDDMTAIVVKVVSGF